MSDTPPSDLNKLAMEALDLWQAHLAALATDPKAKADLAQLMEPSRLMFAQWMEKAQTAPHAASNAANTDAAAAPTDRAAPAGAASDDGALRLAQLTLHVAELEKRVAKLESRKPRAGAAAKIARTAGSDA